MKKKIISIIIISSIIGIILYSSTRGINYQTDFSRPTNFCSEKECEIKLCEPYRILEMNNIKVGCELAESKCKCAVYNYDAFYNGLSSIQDFYNPSANIYKSYNDFLKFIGIKDTPKMDVVFIQGRMQSYSNGIIYVWPNDVYGQYHESIHFLLRQYTQPQEGWYPYLEEGMAHYGAYCYNNPNTARCNYDLGNFDDPDICIPNVGNCKGQILDTSLVLQLRRDYNCDWEHCWKEFLNWAVTTDTLTLTGATNKLNEITGKDIKPLLVSYGIEDKYFQPFTIFYEDEVIEEEIINEKGQFTTLG